MSRMVNHPERHQHIPMRLVLLILAGCLAMHFFVEDAFLSADFASPVSTAAGANHNHNDEMEHQDDLTVPVNLPPVVAHGNDRKIYLCTYQFAKSAGSPNLPPPKIA